jgi:hypothetical protein
VKALGVGQGAVRAETGSRACQRVHDARGSLTPGVGGRESGLRAGGVAALLALVLGSACGLDIAGTGNRGSTLDGGGGGDGDGDRSGNGDGDGDGDGDQPGDGDGDQPGDGDGDAPVKRSCGSVPDGQTEQRQRFPQAVVAHFQDCRAEAQTRTCVDGTFGEWSGSAQAVECRVGAMGLCQPGGTACEAGSCNLSKTMAFVTQCLADDGASCESDDQCVQNCVLEHCAAPSAAGGACDGKDDCDAFACVPGSASCQNDRCLCSNNSFCTDNGQCEGICASGRCAAFNTACDEAIDCALDAACLHGLCVRMDGAACSQNDQCANICLISVCKPRSGFEEPCDESADCIPTLACSPASGGTRKCLRREGASCQAHGECASLQCACADESCTKQACVESK